MKPFDLNIIEAGVAELIHAQAAAEPFLDAASQERLRALIQETHHWLGFLGGFQKCAPAIEASARRLSAPLQSVPARAHDPAIPAGASLPAHLLGGLARRFEEMAADLREAARSQAIAAKPTRQPGKPSRKK